MTITLERTPKKKALLIGISYRELNRKYKKEPVGRVPGGILHEAHKNARHVKRLLITTLGFLEEDIVMMRDKSSSTDDLIPTQANIRREIARLVEGTREGDYLFFSYSGHGEQRDAVEDKQEIDGKDEAIVGCDDEIILDNELKKTLAGPRPIGSHLMVLWDTCHSGTMLDLAFNEPQVVTVPKFMVEDAEHRIKSEAPYGYSHEALISRAEFLSGQPRSQDSSVQERFSPRDESAVGSPRKSYQPTFLRRASVISISACRDDQSAWEGPKGSLTEFFVKAMQKHPHQSLRKLLVELDSNIKDLTADRHAASKSRGYINRASPNTLHLSHNDSDSDSDESQDEGQYRSRGQDQGGQNIQDQDQDQREQNIHDEDEEGQDIQVAVDFPLDNEYDEPVDNLI